MKLDIKKYLNKHPFRSFFSRRGTDDSMNPVRDWTIGLTIATIGFITGVSFIGFDFYMQIKQVPEAVTVEIKPIIYKEREVVRFAEIYAKRTQNFNRLREEKAYIPPEVKSEPLIPSPEGEVPKPLAEETEEQYTEPAPEQVQ